ncbi:MAG: VRR-NUC domain-containing protein [Prevotella sp.]|nr:VRR-NUC domain-containing protein [Prevotella sp.]MBR1880493.1 VRR-NUC domain-containing protein [Prevotella sp.]
MENREIKKHEATMSEAQIQHSCVAWFRNKFADKQSLLFAVPNGGARTGASGAMRKYEGALAGAPDLILLHKRGGYGALLIEMKTPKVKGQKSAGRQSKAQETFQSQAEEAGYKYIVCHGIEEFVSKVCEYAHIRPDEYLADLVENYETYRKARL